MVKMEKGAGHHPADEARRATRPRPGCWGRGARSVLRAPFPELLLRRAGRGAWGTAARRVLGGRDTREPDPGPSEDPRCELGWPPAVVALCSELADGGKDRTTVPTQGPRANSLLPAVLSTRDLHKPVTPDVPLKPSELNTHCQFYSSFVNDRKHQKSKP